MKSNRLEPSWGRELMAHSLLTSVQTHQKLFSLKYGMNGVFSTGLGVGAVLIYEAEPQKWSSVRIRSRRHVGGWKRA